MKPVIAPPLYLKLGSNRAIKMWYRQNAGYIPSDWKNMPAVHPSSQHRSKIMNKDLEPKNLRPLILGNKDNAAHLLEEGLMGDGSIPPEQWHKPDDDRSTEAPSESTVVHDFRPEKPVFKSPAEEYKTAALMHSTEMIRIVEKEIADLTSLIKEIEEYIQTLRVRQGVMSDAALDMADFVQQTEKFTEITRDNVISFVRPKLNKR